MTLSDWIALVVVFLVGLAALGSVVAVVWLVKIVTEPEPAVSAAERVAAHQAAGRWEQWQECSEDSYRRFLRRTPHTFYDRPLPSLPPSVLLDDCGEQPPPVVRP